MSDAQPCRATDNPFASHRVDVLPFHGLALSHRDIEQRIDVLGGRAAIVGPKGSGKTTLLEELADALPAPTFTVRIPGGDHHPFRTAVRQLRGRTTSSHTILVDSAEQLGHLPWQAFLNRARVARRVIATFHRPGRLPTLIECKASPTLLRDLVRELAPEDAQTLGPTLDALFHRHSGNIRSCLRELYDLYAGRITT